MARVMQRDDGVGGFVLRFVGALILLLVTYNPSGVSWSHIWRCLAGQFNVEDVDNWSGCSLSFFVYQ